jgi:hypothetical protein
MSAPSLAQSLADDAGPFYRPILSSQVDRYATIAGLDADQKQSVRALYRGYKDAFKQAEKATSQELEKQLNASRENPRGPQDRRERMKQIRRFIEDTKVLESTFFDDFQAILRPDQTERMKSVKLARSRDYGLRFAAMAGDGVDLAKLFDDLKLVRTSEIAEALDDYESQMQRQLEAKDQIFTTFFDLSMNEAEPDPEKVNEMFSKYIEQSVRIRDLNRQSSRLIASLLPEEKQDLWNRELKVRTYPTVYRKLAADKALIATKEFKQLTDSQRDQLTSIQESYQRNLEAVNQRWMAAIDLWQTKLSTEGLDIIGSHLSAGSDDPLNKARQERKDLDAKTLSQVKQLFTQDQQAQLFPNDDSSAPQISDSMNDIAPFASGDDAIEDEWASEEDEMEDK